LLKIKPHHVWWFVGIFALLLASATLSIPKKITTYVDQHFNASKAKSATNADESKIIKFVTINSPDTYYQDSNEQYAGLEYDLAKLFVADLGEEYQLDFIVKDAFSEILPALEANEAMIAAADITVTDSRKKMVNFSVPYLDIQQQVAYNRDTKVPPRKLAALKGQKITVPAGTSFAERLMEISEKEIDFTWDEQADTSSKELLEALANEEIDFTIADNHLLSIMQYYYPNIGMGFSIGKPEKIAWALPKNANPKMLAKVNAFFKKIKANGTLNNLIDRYHGNTKRLNPFDVKSFLSKSQTLLPKYTRLFKNAQDVTDIDWRLLASISYQESHWDTFNTSPTNVRGLMMLTNDTSDMMKVSDRLDPKQSIPAGAKFFLWLKEQFPDRIEDKDRTFMALASYNIGLGHVEDARVLAQRMKLDPDQWNDVKKTLVLLNEPKYYARAKNGYCNCNVPILYVESIRSYYQILEKHLPAHDPIGDSFKIASAE
jgi:membrane-bound lytic murein transglycosylase F